MNILKRWRVGVLLLLLAVVPGPWGQCMGQTSPAELSRLSLDQARQELNRVMKPLIKRSERDGLKGKILPDDLPAPPYHWAHPDAKRQMSGSSFLHALTSLIALAVCESDPEAMRFLNRVANAIDGFVFTEPQAIYLERTARTLGIDAPFYRRVQGVLPSEFGGDRVPTEPQRVMRITVAFDERRAGDALTLVPAFNRLCRS